MPSASLVCLCFLSKHKSCRAIFVCITVCVCSCVCLCLDKRQLNHFFFPLLTLSLQGNQASLIFEARKQYFIENRRQRIDEEYMVRDLNNSGSGGKYWTFMM